MSFLDEIDSLDAIEVLNKTHSYLMKTLKAKNVNWYRYNVKEKNFSSNREAKVNSQFLKNSDCILFNSGNKIKNKEVIDNNFLIKNLLSLKKLRKTVISDDLAVISVFNIFNDCLLGIFLVEVDEKEKHLIAKIDEETLNQIDKIISFSFDWQSKSNQIYMDDLSGLLNQRALDIVVDRLIDVGENNEFSVLFIDIDYFKLINDTKGHVVGSKVLTELGQMLKEFYRSSDFAFRYGGDEFIVVLTKTDSATAEKMAESFREAIEEKGVDVEGIKVELTISVGLASYPQHAKSSESIIKMADQAMYYGKNLSRNIVYLAS